MFYITCDERETDYRSFVVMFHWSTVPLLTMQQVRPAMLRTADIRLAVLNIRALSQNINKHFVVRHLFILLHTSVGTHAHCEEMHNVHIGRLFKIDIT